MEGIRFVSSGTSDAAKESRERKRKRSDDREAQVARRERALREQDAKKLERAGIDESGYENPLLERRLASTKDDKKSKKSKKKKKEKKKTKKGKKPSRLDDSTSSRAQNGLDWMLSPDTFGAVSASRADAPPTKTSRFDARPSLGSEDTSMNVDALLTKAILGRHGGVNHLDATQDRFAVEEKDVDAKFIAKLQASSSAVRTPEELAKQKRKQDARLEAAEKK